MIRPVLRASPTSCSPDTRHAWELARDGTGSRVRLAPGEPVVSAQASLVVPPARA